MRMRLLDKDKKPKPVGAPCLPIARARHLVTWIAINNSLLREQQHQKTSSRRLAPPRIQVQISGCLTENVVCDLLIPLASSYTPSQLLFLPLSLLLAPSSVITRSPLPLSFPHQLPLLVQRSIQLSIRHVSYNFPPSPQ
jgi:hypothetical protein